jgi:predicted nuclease of predicted toxin-antitoxin system
VKRVLFDENMPRKLRHDLAEFDIRTAQEEGWASFRNGELLRRAAERFDVLVTLDHGIEYQQNLTGLRIAVVIVHVRDARLRNVRRLTALIRDAISSVARGEVRVIR